MECGKLWLSPIVTTPSLKSDTPLTNVVGVVGVVGVVALAVLGTGIFKFNIKRIIQIQLWSVKHMLVKVRP